MKPKTRREFVGEVRAEAQLRVDAMSDVDLVTALSMYLVCDEPLKGSLGLKTDWQQFFVVGVKIAIVQYGQLTHKQRKVAGQMVAKGLVHLILMEHRDQTKRSLGMSA